MPSHKFLKPDAKKQNVSSEVHEQGGHREREREGREEREGQGEQDEESQP